MNDVKSMTILYAPTVGRVVPDGEIEKWYQDLLKTDAPFCQVGSDLMVLRCRLGRKEGDVGSLIVKFQGIPYGCDEDGQMEDGYWAATSGSADLLATWIFRLLD